MNVVPQMTMPVRFAVILCSALVALTGLAAETGPALVLSPKSLGPLRLAEGATVSEQRLKTLFPAYTVTYDIGQGDSPDFHYFEVVDSKGEVLFTIQSFIEESSQSKKTTSAVPIQLLQIHTRRIRDIYGLRVGDRVKDIIKKRGEALDFGASHHDVYLGAGEIFYNIANASARSPEDLTREDAVKGNWQVKSISWPGPAWD